MRVAPILGVVACLACGPADPISPPEPASEARATGPIPASTRQLVLVVGAGWNDTHGRAQRFEREVGGDWRAVGDAFDVVFGHAGLAWGRGLHGQGAPEGMDAAPIKAEGDGRSPAGVFSIGAAYGRAPANAASTALPYTPESPTLRCVDDPSSAHYNRVVDVAEIDKDWASAEPMRRYYELAIVIEHNPDHDRGGGSCIFLHPWKAPDTPVTGCTAMASASLERLAAWLERDALIVTLPRAAMERLREPWSLPVVQSG